MFPKRNLEAIRLDEMSSGEGQTVTESLKSESQGSSTTYDASATSSNGDFLHHSKPANHAETDDLGPGTNPSSLNQQLLLLHSLLGGGGMALAQNAQRVSQQALISQINQATSSLAALKGTNMQMTNKKNGCLSQEIQQPSTTEPTTPHIGNQPGGDHSEEGPGRTDIVVQPLLGLDETGSVFESKMPPGAIMAPCRARGMPQDHNCKTAYFVIPKEIVHGEGLHCSHAGCREKGARFRYCSVCALPVAKRNFSTRHHHGDLVELSIRRERGLLDSEHQYPLDGSDSTSPPLSALPPDSIPANLRYVDTNVIASPQYAAYHVSVAKSKSSSPKASAQRSAVRHKEAKKTTKRRADENGNQSQNAAKRKRGLNEDSSGRQQWQSLMLKRPCDDDENAMAAWLMEVMAVSEKERHVQLMKRASQGYSASESDEGGTSSSTSPSTEESGPKAVTSSSTSRDTSSGGSTKQPGDLSDGITTSSTSNGCSDSARNNSMSVDTSSEDGGASSSSSTGGTDNAHRHKLTN